MSHWLCELLNQNPKELALNDELSAMRFFHGLTMKILSDTFPFRFKCQPVLLKKGAGQNEFYKLPIAV